MPTRTPRTEIEIEPGVHVLKPQNDERTVCVLVVRDGKIEIWLKRADGVEWQ